MPIPSPPRIAKNSGRPLLAGDGIRRWKALFATRKPVYERLADIVLDVRQGTVPQLGLKLEAALCDFVAGKSTRIHHPRDQQNRDDGGQRKCRRETGS